ncbi:MazG family protein [Pedococcus sp. 5OH_020]|uniref:MazG family protein n=1 Tax=Pedococcus sp. 5OH_020 TaxID=2989814 RepID=UPI0022E9F3EE|nr:MazG family protein [Pedococcus sp. 5OH_020]
MAGRLALLVGTPRIAPGLFTRAAWHALDSAAQVLARDTSEPLAQAVAEAGVPVEHLVGLEPAALARTLLERAQDDQVVWVASADADPGLTDAVASEVSRLGEPPEVEVLVASWDVPGSRLLDLVAVMDRLRSPGGCPWDAEQTHESLVKYLLEESYEAVEAIESGDRGHLREELGDVLLQVAFQSRVAQDHPQEPFDIDDVAAEIVAKLVRRHPHVFADGEASTAAEVEQAWERIKAEERATKQSHHGGEAGHEDLMHGIPTALPSLLAAEKVVARWERAGRDPRELTGDGPGEEHELGTAMLDLVVRARAGGRSAEQVLRSTLRRLTEAQAQQTRRS